MRFQWSSRISRRESEKKKVWKIEDGGEEEGGGAHFWMQWKISILEQRDSDDRIWYDSQSRDLELESFFYIQISKLFQSLQMNRVMKSRLATIFGHN